MSIIDLKVGKGLTNSGPDDELHMNFASDVPVQKLDTGLYISKQDVGDDIEGRIDYHTIQPMYKTPKGTCIGINHDVVVCIYTMSYKKRASLSSDQDHYNTTSGTKTVEDIIDEMNVIMDYYYKHRMDPNGTPQSVPDGMMHTSYLMKQGDFFQFRTKIRPTQRIYEWPCAQDDTNRYEDDPIVAFFYIEEAEYGWSEDPYYLTKLKLKCVWSTLADYVVGQEYAHTASPPY